MTTIRALSRSFRYPLITAYILAGCCAAYLLGRWAFEIDIFTSTQGRTLSVGEVASYVCAAAAAWEVFITVGPWERGWVRHRWRGALACLFLATGAVGSGLCASFSVLAHVGADVRWWVPVVNSAVLGGVIVLCSRVLPKPHFLVVPFLLIIVVLLAQLGEAPGSFTVLLADYDPARSPGLPYWIATIAVVWLLNAAPLERLRRFVPGSG